MEIWIDGYLDGLMDPDPHEDFCPDPDPQKKKCGSETLEYKHKIILRKKNMNFQLTKENYTYLLI